MYLADRHGWDATEVGGSNKLTSPGTAHTAGYGHCADRVQGYL